LFSHKLVIYYDKQIIESYIDRRKLATLDLLRLNNKSSIRFFDDCDEGTKMILFESSRPTINENGINETKVDDSSRSGTFVLIIARGNHHRKCEEAVSDHGVGQLWDPFKEIKEDDYHNDS